MISVIIPAFNSERTIARAIESVLSQGYTDYEIIVVDDGSTDDTANAVKRYGPKVIYIYQENAGPSVARNTALSVSKGPWIAFLDSDDEWLPGKLQKQIQLLDRNPGLRWCSTNRYQSDGRRKAAAGNADAIAKALEGRDYFSNYFTAASQSKCPIITTTLIVHRQVFEQLGGFDPSLRRGQDIDMWWRIAHYHPQIGYVPQPLAVRYVDVENPVTRKHRLEIMDGSIGRQLAARHLAMAKEKGSIDQFKPFIAKAMHACLLAVLFYGHKKQARDMVGQFPELFPWYWRAETYILTLCPKATSAAARTAFYVLDKSGLRGEIGRKPPPEMVKVRKAAAK